MEKTKQKTLREKVRTGVGVGLALMAIAGGVNVFKVGMATEERYRNSGIEASQRDEGLYTKAALQYAGGLLLEVGGMAYIARGLPKLK